VDGTTVASSRAALTSGTPAHAIDRTEMHAVLHRWLVTDGVSARIYEPGGRVTHGDRHAMPVGHEPAQRPVATGAQADPGGKPCAMQSASLLHAVQGLMVLACSWQKKLPAVV
jgi:hypothetical protein